MITAMEQLGDLTGNHYVSLSGIGRDGAIDCVNVLWPRRAGLVEWHGPEGEPLLRIGLRVGGEPVSLESASWRRLDRWLPAFTLDRGGASITCTIFAPAGGAPARGFIVCAEVENRGQRDVDVELSLSLHWAGTRLHVATARPFGGRSALHHDEQALVLVSDEGGGPALVLHGGSAGLHDGDAAASSSHGRVTDRSIVRPGRRGVLALHGAAGREQDAARAAARALRRTPAEQWLRETRLELSHVLQPGGDARWSELLNRNLLFNRYFAVARGLDDDRLYLLRSRSGRCPAPAVFNEREGLFWTLPALVITDPPLAREAFMRMLELFSERSGEHERGIDGGAFDAGLNTEQMLLYAWAAAYYVDTTGDLSLLDEPLLQHVLRETDFTLFARLHPEHLLVSTELLPSGDAADEPWGTVANVLLATFAKRLEALLAPDADAPPQFRNTAAEIAAAVWQHAVSDVGGDTVLVSSTDLEGRATVYDDPAFSLLLLPFLGFCDGDDPVWLATAAFLRSPAYPLWREGSISGAAHRADARHPRLSGLLADVLAPRSTAALDRLGRLRLPNGLACAAWDPETGAGVEPDNAALAGLLAWTVRHATQPAKPAAARSQRRGARP